MERFLNVGQIPMLQKCNIYNFIFLLFITDYHLVQHISLELNEFTNKKINEKK